jgi:hypothetical protein
MRDGFLVASVVLMGAVGGAVGGRLAGGTHERIVRMEPAPQAEASASPGEYPSRKELVNEVLRLKIAIFVLDEDIMATRMAMRGEETLSRWTRLRGKGCDGVDLAYWRDRLSRMQNPRIIEPFAIQAVPAGPDDDP